ncbi:helix-turn-helix transcriptional regulator [Actinosynnema pretiosum subsp. pretiosum]|uniref:Helix-turn-helix transcriptional regulator n=1 Tax=Actinosynnema pretiosum subsp. pretiosum TaxID=103721 RepID=A0AA45R4A8_9PSEU|nr:regulatory protein [Actinosynnema pretiosum subsp. pretiosum]QUF04727.1 helix-turn-helix transcriptional regulator [Actinosynnema pretiosum subsp. pretiosum]
MRRKKLEQRRVELGYSQEGLAAELDVDRSTYARWERGVQGPYPWNRPRLAKALGLTPPQLRLLLDEDDEQPTRLLMPSSRKTASRLAGNDVIDALHAKVQEIQLDDRKAGGGLLLPELELYLAQEVAPLLTCTGVPARELFAATASITGITGWMAHDSGRDDQARQYFDRAYRLAQAADDHALAANACASMAHLAVELHQPQDALRIAAEGMRQARSAQGASRLVARLHSMRARALAQLGDHFGTTQALTDAEAVLGRASDEEPARWIAGFDHASLAAEAALCHLHLATQGEDGFGQAELREAERHAREVIRLRAGDRLRSRVFAQVILANVLARLGRTEESAQEAHTACRAAVSLSSARVVHRLQELGGVLSLAPGVPEVLAFRAALAGLAALPAERRGEIGQWPV